MSGDAELESLKMESTAGIVVYSCIVNGRDDCRHILQSETMSGVSFILYTDSDIAQPSGFTIRRVSPGGMTPRRFCRCMKHNAHRLFPNAAVSVWLDGTLRIKSIIGLLSLISDLKGIDIATPAHTRRNCLYDEGLYCILERKDDAKLIMEQLCRYKQAGCPATTGLAETRLIIRRHNQATAEFNDQWWSEICAGCQRDQVSFPYAIWKTKAEYLPLPVTKRIPAFLFRRTAQRRTM